MTEQTPPRPPGPSDRAVRVSVRCFRALTRVYPKTFRDDYGGAMTLAFKDLLRDTLARRGAAGLISVWARTLLDIAATALRERRGTMRMGLGSLLLLAFALALGPAIAWVDSRPNWDDTGITAGVVFLVAALFGAISPRRAWLWALAIGGWIPVLGIASHRNYGTLIALAPAFIGAYIGAFLRSLVLPPASEA